MPGNVLVSGAGVGGSCLAWWLDRYGYRVTLVEQAPEPRTGGYVIDFWGLGYDVAEKMGVLDELRRHDLKVQEFRIVVAWAGGSAASTKARCKSSSRAGA